MGLELWLAGVALCLSVASALVACVCAWKPPQQRDVRELRAIVEEVAADQLDLHQRVLARSRKENMDHARAVHETKRQRQQRIEEDAVAVIEAAKQGQLPMPADPDTQRAALRKKFLQ